jgi:hypothetical protein
MKTTKNNIDGLNLYQIGGRGISYNRNLREWELYDMDEDGSIQDLHDRTKHREHAEEWLNGK